MRKQWFFAHMENDGFPDKQPVIFGTFIENIKIVFPSMERCPENQVCELFQEFTDGIRLEKSNIFWKKIEI